MFYAINNLTYNLFICTGHTHHPSLYKNLQLVVWQYLLPYDDREPCARLKTFMRNFIGLQDGRSLDFLHFINAHEHEQATYDTNQIATKVTYVQLKYIFHGATECANKVLIILKLHTNFPISLFMTI